MRDNIWRVNGDILEVERNNNVPFMYSQKLNDEMLTFKYFDYLAWAIYKSKAKKILLLGLAGGTVLQLLKKWGYTPQCTAVEIDKEITKYIVENNWLNYPELHIEYADALYYEIKGNYDAIIVDLYNDTALIQEAYSLPKLKYLKEHLTDDGAIYLHCYDPIMRFKAFNLIFSNPMPSITLKVAEELKKCKLKASIFPYWTSSLVIGTNSNKIPEYLDDNDIIEIRWLDLFLKSKQLDMEIVANHFQEFNEDFTFLNIDSINQLYLGQILTSCSKEIQQKIKNILNLPEGNVSISKLFHARELFHDEIREVSKTRITAAIIQTKLIQSGKNKNEIEYLLQELLTIADEDDDQSIIELLSYSYALQGDFKKAIALLIQPVHKKN